MKCKRGIDSSASKGSIASRQIEGVGQNWSKPEL
jgi:hypothetical protein